MVQLPTTRCVYHWIPISPLVDFSIFKMPNEFLGINLREKRGGGGRGEGKCQELIALSVLTYANKNSSHGPWKGENNKIYPTAVTFKH